jgi:hypothetical protein
MREQFNQDTNEAVGCLRGIILIFITLAFSIGIGVSMGIKKGIINGNLYGAWKGILYGIGNGLLYSLGIFFVGIILTIIIVNTAKKLTTIDCILPLIISIICAVIFAPLHLLQAEIFSIMTCIGSGFIFSMTLFYYKAKKIGGGWLIIPALVFCYEILPINLPTEIDNFICLGGGLMNYFFSYISRKSKDDLLKDNTKRDM